MLTEFSSCFIVDAKDSHGGVIYTRRICGHIVLQTLQIEQQQQQQQLWLPMFLPLLWVIRTDRDASTERLEKIQCC